MRALLELLVGFSLTFVAVKYSWPWPLLLVIGYLIALGLRLSVLSRYFQVKQRFLVFLGIFITAAFLLTHVFENFLLWNSVQNEIIEPSPILRFLLASAHLKVFWSVILGFTVPMLAMANLLALYGLAASQSMYSQYEQYRGHEAEAAYAAVAGLLGINRGTWIVSDGKAEVHGGSKSSLARFGGPGILIVQEGHAVILERSGRLSRVVGRGITWLEAFERISMVVPLFGCSEKVVVEQVATRDRILIDEFEVLVFHRIDAGPEEEQVQDGQFAYNEASLRRDVWSPSGGDWRGGVRSVSDSAVRDMVGRYDLEQLVPTSDAFREKFKNDLKQAISKVTCRAMGVEVIAVDIGKVKIPEEAKRRLMEKWLADWAIRIAQSEREALIRKGEAEAMIMKVKEVAWAQAQKQVIEEIASSFQSISVSGKEASYVIALRALETIEKMAGDPATKILLPPEMFMQLRDLRETIGGDVFSLPARRTS